MATIDEYKAAWAKASAAGDKAGMDAAHAGAEAIRAQQGYSGGTDGSQRISLSGGSYGGSTGGSSSGGGYVGTGTHNDQGISAQDMALINASKRQYESKKAEFLKDGVISPDEQQILHSIHNTAEMIRGNYNYSGGTDGSEYIPVHTYEPAKSPIRSGSSQADYINSLYKAQQEAALSRLKAAYEQNMIDMNAAAAKIPQTYQAARNQTAAVAEQNRAAFNERAAAYGLNSGAGGQADLAMRNQNAFNMSATHTQEANAVNDLETTRLKLSTAYQNDIAQAIAQGDIARAQALYNEAVRVDNSLVQQSMTQADENYRNWAARNSQQQQMAETLAKYGDFSGYLALGYTQEQVDAMQARYNAVNFSAGRGGGYSVETPPKGDSPGNGGGEEPPFPENPQNLHSLNVKLSEIESRSVDVNINAKNTIKQYLEQGLISEASAKKMLASYGM